MGNISKSLITARNKSSKGGEFETNMKKMNAVGRILKNGLPDSRTEVKLIVIIGF